MIENNLSEIFLNLFELFMILTLVAFGVYFSTQTPLNDITKVYVERACVNGGFSSSDISSMNNELTKNGFDISKITYTVLVNGSPNSDAVNIDTTGKFVKRGNIISLKIYYSKKTLLDGIFKKLNSNAADTRNSCIRYGMSERNK